MVRSMDVSEKNDMVDLIVAYFEGVDSKDLDDVVRQVKTRLALAAAGEGVQLGQEVTLSR